VRLAMFDGGSGKEGLLRSLGMKRSAPCRGLMLSELARKCKDLRRRTRRYNGTELVGRGCHLSLWSLESVVSLVLTHGLKITAHRLHLLPSKQGICNVGHAACSYCGSSNFATRTLLEARNEDHCVLYVFWSLPSAVNLLCMRSFWYGCVATSMLSILHSTHGYRNYEMMQQTQQTSPPMNLPRWTSTGKQQRLNTTTGWQSSVA
jgi:hypothetical protein